MKEFLNYTLFTIGGDVPVLLIDLVTSVLGLTCVFLAGRNSKYNFWVGYLYTTFLFLMFWNKNLYASLLLQPVSLGINILGHYRWTHPKKSEESSQDHSALKVSMLTWPQRGAAVVSVGVAPQPAREQVVRRDFPVRPDSLSGRLRDRAHTCGTVPFGLEEVGLLDSMAAGECDADDIAHIGRPCVHADSVRPLPHKRHSFAVRLVQAVSEEGIEIF